MLPGRDLLASPDQFALLPAGIADFGALRSAESGEFDCVVGAVDGATAVAAVSYQPSAFSKTDRQPRFWVARRFERHDKAFPVHQGSKPRKDQAIRTTAMP